MSDPKRYRFFGQVTQVDESGNTTDSGWAILSEWVEWKEYARLKAENTRLRKAGDEMIYYWSSGTGTDLENFTQALWLWTTAKQTNQNLTN